MVKNFTKWGNMFDAPEQELKDQLIQHGVQDCYRICDERHPGSDLGNQMLRNACSFGCRTTNWDAPEHRSQGSTANDIKSTLQDIGDNFHALADSFSVL